MKKLYFFFSLCLALIGLTSASAQITSTSEFANDKCYTVKNSRSSWVCDASGLNTIATLAIAEDATDANQQFAFLSNDEGETFYLYSVGQKAFINNDGTLSQTADYPLYFKNGEQAGTFVAYFDGDHNINIGGSNQMTVDWWSTADAGNSNFYIEAAEFDATELLALLPAPVVDPAIKNISELSNNMLYTVVQKNHNQGVTSWAIAEGGAEFVSSAQIEGAVAGQEDDTKQQFAFITNNELTYIYHAAEKKFVNKDRSLSDTPVDAVSFEAGVFKNTFVVKFDNEHYVNVGGSKQMEINGWSTADGGNSCSIIPVEEFDPTEVLKLFVVPTTVESITPQVGEVEAIPSTITFTFSQDISAVGTFQVMSQTGAGGDLTGMEGSYAIDGKNLTLNIPADFVAPLKDLTVILQVVDVNGKPVTFSNHPIYADVPDMIFLSYTVPVKADLFEMESSNPAAGVVEKLDTIYVTFNDATSTAAKKFVGGFDNTKQVVLKDSWNDVIATASMSIVKEGNAKTTTAMFVLSDVISIPDTYTLIIPAGTVYNERYDVNSDDFGVMGGATYNPEISIEYQVVAPTAVESITPTPGNIPEIPGSIELIFNNEIKAVNIAVLQSSTIFEFPALQYAIDYNVVTVTIPEEAANCTDLTLVLQVEDAQGKNVTYSNHSLYGEQPGMIFLEYNVVPATTVESIDPACGFYEEMPTTLKLAFSEEIKAVAYGMLRTNATGRMGYTLTEEDYTIAGKELTLNLPENLVAGQSNMNITLSVEDVNGSFVTYAYDPDYTSEGYIVLSYTAPIKADFFALASADPAEGEVEKLDVINVTFNNPSSMSMGQAVGGLNTTKEAVVLNANDEIVAKAAMEIVTQDGWNTSIVKFILETAVTTPGNYTFVIPSATVYDQMYYEYAEDFGVEMGATYNPEIRLAYTVVASETVIESITPELGELTGIPSEIKLTFSNEIKAVNVAMLQSSTVLEFPPMTYSIEGNVVTVNVPDTLAEGCTDLTVILQVEDINGNFVSFSNHEVYGQVPGMIFLSYTVATPAATVVEISPACGHYDALPTAVKILFSENIQALEYGTIRTAMTPFRGHVMSANDYEINGNELTIYIPEEYVLNQQFLQIRMNVVDVNGNYVTYAYDPNYETEGAIILEWTAPLKSDVYVMESSDPAEGEVEKLDVINVSFINAYEMVVGGLDVTKTAIVVDNAGNIVSKAAMEIVQEDGWNTNVVKFTLETPVTAVGEYTFIIPEATVYDEMFYDGAEDFGVEMGATYNPEIRISYTISVVNGINTVVVNNKSGVYTIDGRKVKNGQKLVKGVYVIDGKKTYVK